MTDIRASLLAIEEGLRALGRDVVLRRLQPGISADEARRQLAQVGLQDNEDLVALYQWRNGLDTAITGDGLELLSLFPISYMTSVEHSIADYRALRQSERWDDRWFPIFPDGAGDFYVVTIDGPEVGLVRQFWADEEEAPVEYESVGSMLASIAEGYSKGLYFVKDSGWLGVEDSQFAPIARRHNPSVEWWSEANA